MKEKEKIQKVIWISKNKLTELENKAKELDIPVNSYIKLKLFGKAEVD